MRNVKHADVGLYLATERSNGYFHIRVRAVLLNTETPGSIINASSSWHHDLVRGLNLDNFVIDSQGHETMWHAGSDNAPNTDPRLYGFEARYRDVHVIDAFKAKTMASTLGRIQRKLRKLQEAHGHTESFSVFVTRVAEAIGAKTIVEPIGTGNWNYADTEHRFLSLADGQARIAQLEADWKASVLAKSQKEEVTT